MILTLRFYPFVNNEILYKINILLIFYNYFCSTAGRTKGFSFLLLLFN